MADPMRLRVLKALTAVIAGVTPANGYTSDLSPYADEGGTMRSRVARGKVQFGTEPLPLVSILDHPDTGDTMMGSGGRPVAKSEWLLLVQGWAVDDFDHPTDPAHVLAADVITAIARERAKRTDVLGQGARVMEIHIGQPIVRPAMQGLSDAACFFLTLRGEMAEDLNNPFA